MVETETEQPCVALSPTCVVHVSIAMGMQKLCHKPESWLRGWQVDGRFAGFQSRKGHPSLAANKSVESDIGAPARID